MCWSIKGRMKDFLVGVVPLDQFIWGNISVHFPPVFLLSGWINVTISMGIPRVTHLRDLMMD